MKKVLYLLGVVFALASCSDDIPGWLDPQSNPQEDAKTVTMTFGNASDIDFANITDLENTLVQLFVPQMTAESGAVAEYVAKLYDSSKDNSIELTTDENGQISAAELKSIIETLYGKKPVQRTIAIDIDGYATINGQAIKNSGNTTLRATLVAPFIDSGYWLVGDMYKVGDGSETWGWDVKGAHAFTHQGSGDVYDYPEFQIVFTTTADNQYWKIIPQGNYSGDFWHEGEDGVVGTVVDGDDSMEGSLTTTKPQAGKIAEAGVYRMTINMMDYTYKIEKLDFAPFVYFIGATDGWQKAEQKLATVNFDGNYTGYIYCADPNGWGNEFKFQRVAGSWDNEINAGTFSGGIYGDFADGGGNIKATAGEGIYYVELNLGTYTLRGTRITNMNLVGDFNGWNPGDDAQQMTWDATNYCYVITGAGVTANGWKFTANNDWGINLGENINDLVANGSNLSNVGTTIKLYPTRKTSDKIYCTIE